MHVFHTQFTHFVFLDHDLCYLEWALVSTTPFVSSSKLCEAVLF